VKFLTFDELKALKGVPFTRRHVANLTRAGKFPAAVPLGESRVGWLESEVDAWMEARVEARQAPAPPPAPAVAKSPAVAPASARSTAKTPAAAARKVPSTKQQPVVQRGRRR
jgi:prophage regulatory protein